MGRYKLFLLAFMLSCTTLSSSAQITSFIGLNTMASASRTRSDSSSFGAGFSGGVSYIFWESSHWFIKSGLNYDLRSSGINGIPKYLDVPQELRLTPLNMEYAQHDFSIPIQVFFPLLEKKGNALLLMAGFNIMYTRKVTYAYEAYNATLHSVELQQRIKTAITAGAGYQRRLGEFFYLNIMPVFSADVRSDKPFISFGLTAELFYGVY